MRMGLPTATSAGASMPAIRTSRGSSGGTMAWTWMPREGQARGGQHGVSLGLKGVGVEDDDARAAAQPVGGACQSQLDVRVMVELERDRRLETGRVEEGLRRLIVIAAHGPYGLIERGGRTQALQQAAGRIEGVVLRVAGGGELYQADPLGRERRHVRDEYRPRLDVGTVRRHAGRDVLENEDRAVAPARDPQRRPGDRQDEEGRGQARERRPAARPRPAAGAEGEEEDGGPHGHQDQDRPRAGQANDFHVARL